ncbi:hypothetical protein Ga0123462_0955 [Mariprofundus ferrinatatus]|uniref:Uncharacterized protein n=1 Tax=Mariprofundus ferrinatatus TaxID=1921087 RepID=A0A2K8LA49_9PROT|nr:hypothetical protein [Mariprofundus ferrinatatus]ATX81824.1 hypothetical protein Ga0123462_0955 [Mariprofundus ferrinatatus]
MNSLIPLRRMIIQQKPARVDYRFGSETNSLFYDRSGFAGNHDDVVHKLREILASDSVKVSSGINCAPVTEQRTFAPQAVADALRGFSFSAELRAALLSFAMRMPPLIVRLYPMQRYAFADHPTYINMHRSYQQNGSLKIQDFISQADHEFDEASRLRVMIATYLLGLIAPLKVESTTERRMSRPAPERSNSTRSEAGRTETPSREVVNRNSRVSILSRIIDRIRGL